MAMLWPKTRTVTVTVIATSTSRRRHSPAGNVLRLPCPGRFDAPRCAYFRVMRKGNPRKPAPYLRRKASARLASSPCILSDQPDSEEQSDQPDTWPGGQSQMNLYLPVNLKFKFAEGVRKATSLTRTEIHWKPESYHDPQALGQAPQAGPGRDFTLNS